jgi:site-specific DNA recombinase
MVRAVRYLRVSGVKQSADDRYSLPDQDAKTRQWCDDHGYQVVSVFREVHSGSDILGRPEMDALLDMATRREFDVMVTIYYSRSAREINHQGYIICHLQRYGARMECTLQDYEDNAEGRARRAFAALYADMEHDTIRRRTQDGIQRRVKLGGIITGSRALFGYRWAGQFKTSYEINLESAAVVLRIFRDVLDGKTITSIAAALTTEGVLAPIDFWRRENGQPVKGVPWRKSTIRRIIVHPCYKGEMVANRYSHEWRTKTDARGRTVRYAHQIERDLDDAAVVRLPHAALAIVTPEMAEQAIAQMEANRLAAPRNNPEPEAALLRGGIARCGTCGRALHVVRIKPRERDGVTWAGCSLYRCDRTPRAGGKPCPGGAIVVHTLDDEVRDWVRDRLTNREGWIGKVERHLAQGGQTDRVTAVQAELRKLEQGEKNLRGAIERLDPTEDEDVLGGLVLQLRDVGKRQRTARDDLAALQRDQGAWEALRARLNDLRLWADDAARRLDRCDYQEWRSILRVMVSRVLLYPQGHEPRAVIETPYPEGPFSGCRLSCKRHALAHQRQTGLAGRPAAVAQHDQPRRLLAPARHG